MAVLGLYTWSSPLAAVAKVLLAFGAILIVMGGVGTFVALQRRREGF